MTAIAKIATITSDTGFETCFISFAARVERDGALVADPTAVSTLPGVFQVSGEDLNEFTEIYNGITHPPGTLFSFRVTTTAGSNGAKAHIDVSFETPRTNASECYEVHKDVCHV